MMDTVRRDASASAPRIAVVGSPGAGKTRLARHLARDMGVSHVEIDALYWQRDWQPRPQSQVLEDLNFIDADGGWVLDGQYPFTYGWMRDHAAAVVWIDPPLPVVLSRLVMRTFRRVVAREALWNGNRESVWNALGPSSVIWYALRTRRAGRLDNRALLASNRCGVRLSGVRPDLDLLRSQLAPVNAQPTMEAP